MNRINAAEREKQQPNTNLKHKESELLVAAKAEAESKKVTRAGIADQRREIAKGLEESVRMLNNVDINSHEASALIVVTQHYDTFTFCGRQQQK